MGFMDDLKKLTKPYTEDDDDFDEFDDDARPSRPSRSSTAPKPSYSGFDLDNDDLSSSGSSSNTGRRTLGGSNASNGKVVNIHTTAQMQVVLVKPDRFDNVSDIAEHLRSKHAVVLNLESRIRMLQDGWSTFCPAVPMRSTARSRRSPSARTSLRPITLTSSAI